MKTCELFHKTFGTRSEHVEMKENNLGLEEKVNEALKIKKEM